MATIERSRAWLHRRPVQLGLAMATAACWLAGMAPAAQAAPRPVACTLKVKGKTYLDGVCDFEAEKDGSFRLNGDKYFAYVNITGPGKAEGSWNADPASTHAHTPLGELTRQGACWQSPSVQVCARDLPKDQQAKVTAGRPKGLMVYPDFPGASQSCIGAAGGRWQAGAALVLHNCEPKQDLVFGRTADKLAIDQVAGLCVEPQPGAAGAPAKVVLAACGAQPTAWRATGNSTTASDVRSPAGLCWHIPDLANDKAKFPLAVVARPCSTKADQNLAFFFSKD